MRGDEVRQLGKLRRRLQLELGIGDSARHILADIVEHPLEQRKRLVLIFVDWRLLRIGAQVDDLAQRIERRQMLLPVMVQILEQDRLLDAGPGVGLQFLRLGLDHRIGLGRDALQNDLGVDRFLGHPVVDRRLEVQQVLQLLLHARDIPLLGIAVRRASGADDRVDRLGAHVGDDLAHRLGIHDVGALFIDDLALVVHHVIIFDDLLADVVVARLDLLLRGFDRLGQPLAADRLAVLDIAAHHLGEQRVRTEDSQQIVVEAEVKARQARIALTPRTAAQLVVDAAAFVALGAQHEQTARFQHLLLFGDDLGPDAGGRFLIFGRTLDQIGMLVEHPEFQVAAQLNVGAATRHVGRDGDGAQTARLRHDMRLHLVIASVQHLVRNVFLHKKLAEQFRLLDRHGADQHGLAFGRMVADLLGDRQELVLGVLVELVLLVDARDRHVGRDGDDIDLVDVVELARFGRGGAGHARNLRVHAEVVLEGDRGHGLVLGLDIDALLRLDRLVQALRPATPVHHAAGELVDDDDLAVLHDIVGVALEHHVRAQRLIQMVDDLGILEVVEVFTLEQPRRLQQALGALGAILSQDNRLLLLVLLVIVGGQLLHDRIDADIQFRLVVGRAGDDQRRARLVDQDRVDLVDDRIVEGALHHRRALILHIVA